MAVVSDPISTAEIERLRAENERLKAQAEAATSHGSRGKSVLSAFLIIVACLLAPLSTISVWAKSEVTDTDRYVATIAPLATNPQIQEAVSDRLTTVILEKINVEGLTTGVVDAIAGSGRLNETQETALKAMAGPVASGIESFIGDQVTKIVESPRFAEAWQQANTVAHTALVNALSGADTGALAVENNEVVLNLAPVLDQVKAALVARGFTVAENIPSVDAQLVLFQSESLGKLQSAYSALEAVGFWFPIIVLIMAVAGLLVANKRHVAAIGLGIGLFLSFGAFAIGLDVARSVYLSELPATANRGAAEAVFDTLTLFLKESLITGVIVGALLILAGYFAGPSKSAAAVRGFFTEAAAAVQAQLYRWGATMDAVRGFVRQYAAVLRFAALIIALALIFLQKYKTASFILWTAVIFVIVLFIIQVFASDAEKPAAQPADDESPDRADASV